MLSGKQRSYLRKLSNNLPAIFQVGKSGMTDNALKQFDMALEARELVKGTVLKNSVYEAKEVCEALAQRLDAEIVQVIGNKFVLYRESTENKVIQFSNDMF